MARCQQEHLCHRMVGVDFSWPCPSRSEIDRYKSFLGLNNPDDYKEEAAAMKKRGDFTTVGVDQAAINAARANTPVDGFLSTNELAEGQAAAQ